MIKRTLYGLALSLLIIHAYAEEPQYDVTMVILTSKLLKAIDGKSFGISADLINAILIIRTQILHMLHGVAKDGHREGVYTFDGKKYTIAQLYQMEVNKELPNKTWIKQVKLEFSMQIKPFLELGRGFKTQMLLFIEESLRLHQRNLKHSVLHRWAETDDNNDMAAFNQYVHTFHDLSEFLYELLNFLDDLISSCPKAKQQFIEGLKTEREKKTYTHRFKQLLDQQLTKINKHKTA